MHFSRALTWLEKCEGLETAGTQGAEAVSTRQDLPGRLICVDAESAIRVVDTTTIKSKDVPYTCLSYVWGADQNFRLLQNNKTSLMIGFEYSILPKTIQDAIKVTRRLGYSHLWVDAL
jgi:hypothetical protein